MTNRREEVVYSRLRLGHTGLNDILDNREELWIMYKMSNQGRCREAHVLLCFLAFIKMILMKINIGCVL